MKCYRYKKEFLGKWMKENGLSSYAVADILGLKSVNNIEVWAGQKPPRATQKPKEDQEWMPLIHILRICNTKDIPLSSFIEDVQDEQMVAKRQRRDRETTSKQALELKEAELNHERETRRLMEQHQEEMRLLREEHKKAMEKQEQMMQRTIDSQLAQIKMMQERLDGVGTKKSGYQPMGIAAETNPDNRY